MGNCYNKQNIFKVIENKNKIIYNCNDCNNILTIDDFIKNPDIDLQYWFITDFNEYIKINIYIYEML
jgi:hypothetical protein